MQNAIDDDDMGAIFHAKRMASLERRADNRDSSTRHLVEQGVAFTSHNDGVHLIVAGAWDFWPGTGRWRERKGKAGRALRQGRGVFELIKLIQKDGYGTPL